MLERILECLKQHQETTVGGVNELEAVYSYIQQHPGLRANAIALALSLAKRTLERHLRQLKNASRIEFRGAPKTGGYYCKDVRLP